MRYLILALTAVLATAGAVLCASMGMDYIEIGHGLHPAIAFPAATLLICTIAVMIALYTSIDNEPVQDAEDDLMVRHY